MGLTVKVLLLLICVISASCQAPENLNRFVRLPSADANEQSIEVAGNINAVENYTSSVGGMIRIRTRYTVKLVYCDSYSAVTVDQIGQKLADESGGIQCFRITIPANTAVLNSVLGSTGLRCMAYVNNTMRYFNLMYGAHGGARLAKNVLDNELKILKTIYKDAPHLFWLLVVMIALTLFILIAIPVTMILNNRCRKFE